MNILSKSIIFITYIVCTILLVISIYPGMIDSLLFPVLLILILCMPIFIIIGLFVLIILWRRGFTIKNKFSWQFLKPIVGIILVSCILLKFYVPLRLAFLLSQSNFENFIFKEKVFSSGKIGFYNVDKYITDSVGGKYFRVNYHGDGISPDIISYGFTYQPNPKTSPFGSANYQLFYLNGNWYWFKVSNDF